MSRNGKAASSAHSAPDYTRMSTAERRQHAERLRIQDGQTAEQADAEVGLVKSRRGRRNYQQGEARGGDVVAEYQYLDEHGEPYLQVERTTDKQFPQSYWNGKTWKPGKPKGPKIPYFLPSLLKATVAEPVFITEGEKDAESVMNLELTATCASEGAGKWTPDLNKWFAGRKRIYVLADNDADGARHAWQVASNLVAVADDVRIVNLPGLPDKGDVSDWIAAGHTREELLAECDKAPIFQPWLARCQTNSRGVPLANLANAMMALRSDPALAELIAFDEMERAPLLLAPLPGEERERFIVRPLADADVTAIQEWIQLHGIASVGRDTIHQAVDLRARERAFHPVRDYLDRLVWDREPRVEQWLTAYLGAEDTPYVAAVGRMFLLAMIARIDNPGCQADYVPVLEGDQGDLKSTALRILASDRWFSDQLPPLESKDASQHLRGKWLIEVAELHRTMSNKVEVEAVKAFITRRVERYRPSYGRHDVHEPRQCVLVGSTNRDDYLRDETGNRRFWPVRCGAIDIAALRRDRDQLFAEAVSLYRDGGQWWPDRDFERAFIRPQQDARYDVDEWEGMIAAFLADVADGVKLKDIALASLGFDSAGGRARIGRAEQNRIKAALKRLGWKRGPQRDGYTLWVRGPGAAQRSEKAAEAPAGQVATSERDPDPIRADHADDPM